MEKTNLAADEIITKLSKEDLASLVEFFEILIEIESKDKIA